MYAYHTLEIDTTPVESNLGIYISRAWQYLGNLMQQLLLLKTVQEKWSEMYAKIDMLIYKIHRMSIRYQALC